MEVSETEGGNGRGENTGEGPKELDPFLKIRGLLLPGRSKRAPEGFPLGTNASVVNLESGDMLCCCSILAFFNFLFAFPLVVVSSELFLGLASGGH